LLPEVLKINSRQKSRLCDKFVACSENSLKKHDPPGAKAEEGHCHWKSKFHDIFAIQLVELWKNFEMK